MRFRSIIGLVGLVGVVAAALAFHSAHSQELIPCYQSPVSPYSLFTGSSLLDEQLRFYNPHARSGDLFYIPRGAPYLELCPEQRRPLVWFWYGTNDNL